MFLLRFLVVLTTLPSCNGNVAANLQNQINELDKKVDDTNNIFTLSIGNYVIQRIGTSQNWVAPKAKNQHFWIYESGGGGGAIVANRLCAAGGGSGYIDKWEENIPEGSVKEVLIGSGGTAFTSNFSSTTIGVYEAGTGGVTSFGGRSVNGGVGGSYEYTNAKNKVVRGGSGNAGGGAYASGCHAVYGGNGSTYGGGGGANGPSNGTYRGNGGTYGGDGRSYAYEVDDEPSVKDGSSATFTIVDILLALANHCSISMTGARGAGYYDFDNKKFYSGGNGGYGGNGGVRGLFTVAPGGGGYGGNGGGCRFNIITDVSVAGGYGGGGYFGDGGSKSYPVGNSLLNATGGGGLFGNGGGSDPPTNGGGGGMSETSLTSSSVSNTNPAQNGADGVVFVVYMKEGT